MKTNQYRTHTCGALREEDVGQTVKLSGWVDTIRDHGGVTFLDLRDQYGITQIVMHDENAVRQISKESVITISGPVKKRDAETVNPKIETGTVEVHTENIVIQSKAVRALPFEINESKNTREEIRLRHRFLDLRNPAVRDNILLRSEVISFLRVKMQEFGFTEFQTPILTSSSPEGARDYLVPSRKHHGKFYALPQAPQIFKQLLMVSGFDRYFQIAPCFRDEDSRADRSPGEFYQLDFEMAFAEQEDVLQIAESAMYGTFKSFSDKEISPVPFRRISYAEAMLKYGTDKPDLRNPLVIVDMTLFFSDVDFAPFKNIPVRGIAAPGAAKQSKSFFEKMLAYATEIGMKGLGYISVQEDNTIKGPIVKFLSEEKQAALRKDLSLNINDTLFFIADTPKLVNGLAGQIRTALGSQLNLVNKEKFEFCFIVDYPMFGNNEETGAFEFTHNPFSMPQGGLEALNTKNPYDILAWQYDIVCNGVELSSGAVRNHLPEVMIKAFEIAGYTQTDLETKFPALFNAFHYGAPPHAGMAPGIDRIVMLLAGEENIREVTVFPMNSNAQDLLMEAPCEVTEQQLREVHIRLRQKH
ncbi:MAG: aspartate--tRNA ligase [Treponema sp.]|nr:aspartate--tRNA ligase [Treponema sp.]MCL2271815.1 aspartate--tRNA ligase [Treponema sp.]